MNERDGSPRRRMRRRPLDSRWGSLPQGTLRTIALLHFRLAAFSIAPTPNPDDGWERLRPLLRDRATLAVRRRRRQFRRATAAIAAVVVLTAGISFAGVPMGRLAAGAWRGIVHLLGGEDAGENDVAREGGRQAQSAAGARGLAGDDDRTTDAVGKDPRDTRAEPVHDAVGTSNLTPTAVDDDITTDEDTPVAIDVMANDVDQDTDPLTVAAGQPGDGWVEVERDGTVTYTPTHDFAGVDSFTYSVTDGSAPPAEATVTVTVRPVNDPPVAEDDAAATDEDTRITIPVLMNDVDVDDDDLIIKADQPARGTVEINKDGSLTYQPPPDFNGDDTFLYRLSDGQGDPAVAKVEIKVRPVNDTPVAEDESAVATAGTPVVIDVLGNDKDVDGDALVVESATALHGAVHIAGGFITYTSDPLFAGQDVISYVVSDGAGATDVGEVAVRVVLPNEERPRPAA